MIVIEGHQVKYEYPEINGEEGISLVVDGLPQITTKIGSDLEFDLKAKILGMWLVSNDIFLDQEIEQFIIANSNELE